MKIPNTHSAFEMIKENLVPIPKNLPNKDLDFLRNLTSPHTFKETPIP